MTEPNLIDKNAVNNVSNKINKQYSMTDTNMMVECFANSDKLIETDKRKYYEENPHPKEDDFNYDNDDELDDNLNKYKKNVFTPKQRDGLPKPNSHHDEHINEHTNEHINEHTNDDHDDSHNQIHESEYDPDDETKWTKEELMLRKLDMLRKIGELAKAGVKFSENYGMTSDYKKMKYEYELHMSIRSKQNAVQWMSGMLIGIVKGMELLNDSYNPFDIKFDGSWSNNVSRDITDYYDVLGEIYEKYSGPGKTMPPELKLFFMLSGSAVSIQLHKGLSLANNSHIEDNPNTINELRKKAELEKQEYIKKEHEKASNRATELQGINNARNEYIELQKKANPEKINNSLILSESIKSQRNMKNFSDNLSKQQKRNELMVQNQKLMAVQDMLKSMKQDDKNISDNLSVSSKASKISINPHLDKLLETKSSKSSSSKKKGARTLKSNNSIEIDLNYDMDKNITSLRKKNKTDKTDKSDKIDNNDIDNLTYEAISFGKRSNKKN